MRLLPDDAYEGRDDASRARIDAALRTTLHLVPTEPGAYVDAAGDLWTLDENGWTDRSGTCRPVEYAPMLGVNAPFTPTGQ